jgi:hypothetical protein
MFHTAGPTEIKEGKLTDVYFVRTMEVLPTPQVIRRDVLEQLPHYDL